MKLLFKIFIISFLLFEIVFSFRRYSYINIDGDLAAIALPNKSYQAVLDDPFGINVLLHDSMYTATNRYFVHLSMTTYFNHAPLLLQAFSTPIRSIYYSCALIKTLIQFLLIYLLAAYCTGKLKIWDFDFLLVAALIAPLFQTYGFNFSMGIIDYSITYTFFYAFALIFVLLFFLPFFRQWYHHASLKKYTVAFLILLSIVVCFNGPLNNAMVFIICPAVVLNYFFSNYKKRDPSLSGNRIINAVKKIPSPLLIVFGFVYLVCIYSLYIGLNNSENLWESIPIAERYSRLPQGISRQFTESMGLWLLIQMIIINSIIIRKYFYSENGKKLFVILKFIGILMIIYLLLLPLGGYRAYRFYILRMDTQMPITIALIFYYGISTIYILKNLDKKYKVYYSVALLIFSEVFILTDTTFVRMNTCERKALEKISESSEKIVFLDNDCTVLSWSKTLDSHDSEQKTAMLKRWGVIKEDKLFYQKEN